MTKATTPGYSLVSRSDSSVYCAGLRIAAQAPKRVNTGATSKLVADLRLAQELRRDTLRGSGWLFSSGSCTGRFRS